MEIVDVLCGEKYNKVLSNKEKPDLPLGWIRVKVKDYFQNTRKSKYFDNPSTGHPADHLEVGPALKQFCAANNVTYMENWPDILKKQKGNPLCSQHLLMHILLLRVFCYQ